MSMDLQWHKIADKITELAFPPNNLLVVELSGKKITLARVSARLFAVAYKCPHAGGILAEGFIDAKCQVVCPLHRYKFSLENGRNTSGEGYRLKHWPVEEHGGGVYVGMEQGGLPGGMGG